MQRIFVSISFLTLFGCLCGFMGLVATAMGSETSHAELLGVSSKTPEGFKLIAVCVSWLAFLSVGVIYMANKNSPKQGAQENRSQ